jgi:ribosomal protein S18 acetylase RimI-like enzyme
VPDIDVAIRGFAPSDREGVIELMLALQRFERALAPDHAEPTRAFGEWYFERLLKEVRENQGAILVATHDGAPCGLVAGYDAEDPEARSRYFYIAELSVSEPVRGRGIGARLIAAMEDIARARNYKTVVIGVLATSGRVHALYNRLGYRDYAVRLRKTL